MDTVKAIQSLGELVYEFAVALILLPRTFLKVIRNPGWVSEYLTSITEEKPKLRFEKYSHPVMFWIALGVAPNYFAVEILIQGYAETDFLKVYNEISEFVKIGAFVVFFISLPVACAFILQLFKYRGFTKTTFKRSFFIQCYLTVPFQLYYIPAFGADELPETWGFIATIVALLLVLWFLVAEVIVIRKELSYKIIGAIGILVLMYLSYFVFAFITTILFFAFNVGTLRKIVDAWLPDLTPLDSGAPVKDSL